MPDDELTELDDELTTDEDVELDDADDEVLADAEFEVDVDAVELDAWVEDDEVPGIV